MIGILLAGGRGTRLMPATLYLNKHLLPVGDRPMMAWPLKTMIDSGIRKIVVVAGDSFSDQVINAVLDLNIPARICYAKQYKPLGMPDAIRKARRFVGNDSVFVCAADNIFGGNYSALIRKFKLGEISMLRQVSDPSRFGVPMYVNRKLVAIEEKPKTSSHNWIVSGPHIFDNKIWKYIMGLVPSTRGELEISDLHQRYLELRQLKLVKRRDYWIDCGTYESLIQAQVDYFNHKYK